MAFSILLSVKDLFSHDFTCSTAASMEESESEFQQLLNAAIPAVLARLCSKAVTGENAQQLLRTSVKKANDELMQNFTQYNSPDGNELEMLKDFFGDKLNGIINLLSSHACISETKVVFMLSVINLASIHVLGRYAVNNNLTARGLTEFLAVQEQEIINAIPAGLQSIVPMLRIQNNWSMIPKDEITADDVNNGIYENHNRRSSASGYTSIFIALLLLLLGALGVLFFYGIHAT